MRIAKILVPLALTILIPTISSAQSTAVNPSTEKGRIYLVSNAHLDTQWNWDVQTTIGEYIPKTMDMNFTYFEKYPWYIFNFEGGVVYSWMKEYYPAKYEVVKKYIKEGRWHISGASWDANDPNMPSPESFSRNILYGQQYYENEFGVRSTDIFLPDCFGFGWTLPSVAAHFGLIGFSTQKLQWRSKPFYGNRKVPFDLGLWQGIDGNRIFIADNCRSYAQRWPAEFDLNTDEVLDGLVKGSGLNMANRYFGTGDTGGAASISTMECINGTLAKDGKFNFVPATSDQVFKDHLPFDKHPELQVWNDELLMDVHATGCYSSQAAMKLFNRRNEQMADAAERSAVAAELLGGRAYPSEVLSDAWKRFIWHQFHDDLTGTSIPRAYEFSWNDEYISLKQFEQVLEQSVQATAAELDTKVKGTPVVIYNPSAFARSEVVTLSVAGKQRLVKVAAPACGYTVVDLGKRDAGSSVKAKGNVLENQYLKVQLDANGDICSIVDKRNKKEMVAEGKAIRLAAFSDNKSTEWPAWEIIRSVMEKEGDSLAEGVKITASGSGSLRGVLTVERSYKGSKFVQTISLADASDVVEVENQIDWATKGTLLKLEVPLTCANPVARYDLGLGSVERGNNTDTKYEVYAHQWADLTAPDGSYGVAVANDCKYGWDKPSDNTIRLTLLHTPAVKKKYTYQANQDLGHHVIRYAIMPHQGSFVEGNVVRKAEAFNQPLKAFTTTKHAGKLGRSTSLVSCSNSNIAVRAIKKSEDGKGYIVRLYELGGAGAQSGTLSFGSQVAAAYECNGQEDIIAPVAAAGKAVNVEVGRFGIKTYKIEFAAAAAAKALAQAPVQLPYTLQSATYNGFWRDVNFDGRGNSMAAELLPQAIDFGGVEFQLADPARKNALLCRGQEITLPQGQWKMLYLLACSTTGNCTSSMNVGGSAVEVKVPAYEGFLCQWGHTGHTTGYAVDAQIAWVGSHSHNSKSNSDRIYEHNYMFCIPVVLPAGATTVQLPMSQNIAVLAATVVVNPLPAVEAAADFKNLGIAPAAFDAPAEKCNLLPGCPVIAKSGQTKDRECAEFAADDSQQTKWCDTSDGDKYITFDLGSVRKISSWTVTHAGLESHSYITSDFQLEVSADNQAWTVADSVKGNKDNDTNRKLGSVAEARYIRLRITAPTQGTDNAARIYEFGVYSE